ncbi:hypothetical protein CSKR_111617 [Clonorchis sinensis]|uniref:Uncharacterized protein n=1 Tax=Clonorchis sinensis TaxID=79923 RepID=A0A419QDJ0_CLOSI|nr:hypothetical protein CSKR_111617 [Clonorchis sinensis]
MSKSKQLFTGQQTFLKYNPQRFEARGQQTVPLILQGGIVMTQAKLLVLWAEICDPNSRAIGIIVVVIIFMGARWFKWLERESTDRKVRGSNPASAPGLPMSRLALGILALVHPSGDMARLVYSTESGSGRSITKTSVTGLPQSDQGHANSLGHCNVSKETYLQM